MQFSTIFRNGALDGGVAALGEDLTIDFYEGPLPASVRDADTGLHLASGALPAVWMNPAQGGVKDLMATRHVSTGDRIGQLGYFRVRDGAATHIQGNIVALNDPGEGGDMIVSSLTVEPGRPIEILAFRLTAGGA